MKALKYFIIPTIALVAIACTPKPKPASNLEALKSADTALIMKTEQADSTKAIDTASKIETKGKVVTPKQLIIPGKSIGQTTINESMETVFNRLGRPDHTDAAMGSALAVWYADHKITGYKTAVFSHHNYSGKDDIFQYVKRILVTSPYFKTAEGIGVGSTPAQIRAKYTLTPGRDYQQNGTTTNVFNDVKRGISFEIDPASNKCIGVLIQKAGNADDASINMN